MFGLVEYGVATFFHTRRVIRTLFHYCAIVVFGVVGAMIRTVSGDFTDNAEFFLTPCVRNLIRAELQTATYVCESMLARPGATVGG